MKALHEIPAPPPVYLNLNNDDDEEEGDGTPRCECGSRRFTRYVWEQMKETQTLDWDRGNPSEDWDTVDSEVTDSDPWECSECGEQCNDELSDLIQELF